MFDGSLHRSTTARGPQQSGLPPWLRRPKRREISPFDDLFSASSTGVHRRARPEPSRRRPAHAGSPARRCTRCAHRHRVPARAVRRGATYAHIRHASPQSIPECCISVHVKSALGRLAPPCSRSQFIVARLLLLTVRPTVSSPLIILTFAGFQITPAAGVVVPRPVHPGAG